MRALLVFVLVVSGCATYSVRRAALVPHLAPTPRNGQPLDGRHEVSIGSSTLVSAHAPGEGDTDAGVEIPRVDLNGALRFRIGDDVDLGFVWDQGLEEGARGIAEDQPTPDNGDVFGGGFSLQYAAPFPAEPRFRIGMTLDLLYYSVPYVEYRTCVEGCAPMTTIERGRAGIPVISIGMIPSYRFERWTVYGGLTARNHPTIERGEIESDLDFDSGSDEVSAGPFNLVASAGVDVPLHRSLRASLQLYQAITQTPVAYGPTLAVAVAIPFGF